MIGVEYMPYADDKIVVLARGGILVANPKFEPFIIHADGTREVLRHDKREAYIRFDKGIFIDGHR